MTAATQLQPGEQAPAGLPLPRLPEVREDLVLFASADNSDGSPTWTIQDPVRNRFIQVGWLEFELLSRWEPDPVAVLRGVTRETILRPSVEDVLAFAQFLRGQGLVRLEDAQDLAQARSVPRKPGIANWHWWLHNYLFFRIPLVRPDQWLKRLAAATDFLFSAWTLAAVAMLSVIGGVLAFRQGEVFLQTFVESLTFSGLAGFACALILAKTLHEMGHAVVATRHGVRVAHMGVAFLVLWPMLYTDTGESWRLRNHRGRLQIAAAGIAVEMALAGLSLLGWALTPPGPLRSAFFYLATTSLLMTLALNSTPFMRFDGYYVLSDTLGMPNLHERSGAVARTWLRRTLLGWAEPWPEPLPPGKRRAMLVFALATWLYRLVLFLGIAVAVYLMFFKLLGIFLFAVEIAWFVVRPIAAEMKVWWRRRDEVRRGHRSGWLVAWVAGIGLLAFPWAHDIHAPAQLRAEHRTIYSPFAGRIVSVHPPGRVPKGALIVELDSPRLRSEAVRARINADSTRAALQSATVGQGQDWDQLGKLGVTVQQFEAENAAAGEELARLRLVTGFPALWTDTDAMLRPGSWVRPQDAIGTLVNPSAWVAEAWISESDVQHLPVGAEGMFYADNAVDPPMVVTVRQVDTVRASTLPVPAMSAEHGGPIATTGQPEAPVPRETLYLARLEVHGTPKQIRWSRGRIVVEGKRRSQLWSAVNYAAAVLVRESGF